MRVLFVPFDYPTHYREQTPLAWALRAAGHEVLVACGAVLGPTVSTTGMVHAVVGDGYDTFAAYQAVDSEIQEVFGRKLTSEALVDLTDEERKKLLEMMWTPYARCADGMTGDLVRLIREWRADLVIADPWIYAAPLAAQLTGVKLVRHLLGTDTMRYMGAAGQSGVQEGDPRTRWPSPLVRLFDKYEVELRDEYADAVVDPVPASMQLDFDIHRFRMQFVPYNGPGVRPAWLQEEPERPRVCVTWGTMTGGLKSQQRFLLPEVVRSVAKPGLDVVLAVTEGDAERLGDLPDGVRIAPQIPLHLLLPSCSAIVHQGGCGTILTAARYGVPQVSIPEVADQPLYAASLAGTGAGVTVEPDRAVEAGDAVSSLLGDSDHARAAKGLQAELLSLPTPADIAAQLVEFVGK
ncbi:nucleotide disphospho-sugar-binding domain-containing protein [Umezawaea sp. NPDC059074]|uniref:nucleotide disphospho-sugar-binding domain-containing protein n=1 Tax=Umezawaea sp. NPDC059074 TaxID=3346716 RepID=UPI003691A0C9